MRPQDRPVPPSMGKFASEYPSLHKYGTCEQNHLLEEALDKRKEENMGPLTVGPLTLGDEGKMVARYPPTDYFL